MKRFWVLLTDLILLRCFNVWGINN